MSSDRNGFHYEFSIDLPAVHRGVRIARSMVRRFSRMWGMDDREIDALLLVVSELLANTIDHGGGSAAMTEKELESDVRMRMQFVLSSDAWTVSVTDEGGGDPDEVDRYLHPPSGVPDLEDERGRGFFLLAQSVDSMRVQKSDDGRGLTITAQKRHARS